MGLTKEDIKKILRESIRPLEERIDNIGKNCEINYDSFSNLLEEMRKSSVPLRMEVTPYCCGNSPTDPDYEMFRDEDYGIY